MKPIPPDHTRVVCPTCDAPLGADCLTLKGRKAASTHQTRINLARDEYPWHEYHEIIRGHNVGDIAERTRVSRQMDVSDWPVPYTLLAIQRASAGLSDVRVSNSYEGCCDPEVYLEVAGWQA